MWCLISLALAAALLGVAALRADPRRLLRASPSALLRGCLASGLLLISVGLLSLALIDARVQP